MPFVALDRTHDGLRAELQAAFDRVVDRSAFILGSEVEAFEEEFASFCGVERCLGVNSGTAALALSFRALGIGPGDEVIVPAHTYIASALGVVHAGATPVFCDVDSDTGLIDVQSAAQVAGPRTVAVLAVHLYGQMCDLEQLTGFASRHGLALVEDAAQAHGATWDGIRAGRAGVVSAFSFYPSKNLGALGDGGAICTNDAQIAHRAERLRNLGMVVRGQHEVLGYNERLDGLQAALLRAKLPSLERANAMRRGHAREYAERLAGVVALLPERDRAVNVDHLFPVRTEKRESIAARLAAAGVGTGLHYSPAVHEQPPFAHLEPRTTLSNASTWARTELSLPMFPELTHTEIDHVCTHLSLAVKEAAHEHSALA